MGTVFGVYLKYVAISIEATRRGVAALEADGALTLRACGWLYVA